METMPAIGGKPTQVMIAVGGLGLSDPKTIKGIVAALQIDYGSVEFYGQAYEGDRGNVDIKETHFTQEGIGICRELPEDFFGKAACGTAPVLVHSVFDRVIKGPTGDSKKSFDSLIVLAGQKELLWFSERRENVSLADNVRQIGLPVVILIVRQPGMRKEKFEAISDYFFCAAEQVGGVACVFDPKGPGRDDILNITWCASRHFVPMRHDIEKTVTHPPVKHFYNRCVEAFVCSR